MASPFSGSAGRKAGMWAIDTATGHFNSMPEDLGAREKLALDALGRGRTGALSAIDTGETGALGALGTGYAAARPEYEGAIARFDPFVKSGAEASRVYDGSIGLGGDAGRDAAVSSFRATPGYEFRVNQATDAVARKASALGALGSGNTMVAINDRAGDLADQEYGDWQNRLQGVSDRGFAATTAQAGVQKGLGDLGMQYGRDQAGVIGSAAGQRAGTFSNSAAQEAGTMGNFAGMANANAGNFTNTVLGAGTGAMMAGQTAAQNRMNFGMQGLQLGASLLGGAGGIGSLFGGSGVVSNALGAATGFSPFARNM